VLCNAIDIDVSENGRCGLATIGAIQTIHFLKHPFMLLMKKRIQFFVVLLIGQPFFIRLFLSFGALQPFF
jgi:hypothetical protein